MPREILDIAWHYAAREDDVRRLLEEQRQAIERGLKDLQHQAREARRRGRSMLHLDRALKAQETGLAEVRRALFGEVPPSMVAREFQDSVVRDAEELIESWKRINPETAPLAALLQMLAELAFNSLYPLERKLGSPETKRFVVHADLLGVLANSQDLTLPVSEDEANAADPVALRTFLSEALRDLVLPTNCMVVRLPAAQLTMPATATEPAETYAHNDIELVGMSLAELKRVAEMADPWHVERNRRMLDQLVPSASVWYGFENGHTPTALGSPAARLSFFFALGAFRVGVTSDVGGGLSSAARMHLMQLVRDRIMPNLLAMLNDPTDSVLREAGRRHAPDPLVNPERKGPRTRVDVEVLGENLRFDLQAGVGGLRGPQTSRSFVRGHWARWPRLSHLDPLFPVLLDCFVRLDLAQAVGDPATLSVLTQALTDCAATQLGRLRRAPDLAERFLVTLLLMDHPAFEASPWWRLHREQLLPQLQLRSRSRRSYKYPHWRGPEDGDVVNTVTLLTRPGSIPGEWRGTEARFFDRAQVQRLLSADPGELDHLARLMGFPSADLDWTAAMIDEAQRRRS